MLLEHHKRPLARGVAAGVFALSSFGLVACGEDEPEQTAGDQGVTVEDIQEGGEEEAETAYDGPYDSTFEADVMSYDSKAVTVTAKVDEVISEKAFTILGSSEEDVQPLLVVHKAALEDLTAGLAVEVHGVVHKELDLPVVEDQVETDLDDALFEDWDAEPYIEATNVDTSVNSEM